MQSASSKGARLVARIYIVWIDLELINHIFDCEEDTLLKKYCNQDLAKDSGEDF
jgi:hypothetical protein